MSMAIALLVMLIGIVGTLLPSMPGLPLIWLTMLVYGFVVGFAQITPTFLTVTLLVVLATQVAEYYAKAWGAKRYGAGKAGIWGAVIGSIAGLFFMPIGLVLGPFLGATIFELVAGRSSQDALQAGIGGVVGVLGSVAVNFVIALSLTLSFVLKVII